MGAVIDCINTGLPGCSRALIVHESIQLWWFMPVLMAIYVPLCCVRDMEKLAWSHLLGNILILLVIVSIIASGAVEVADTGFKTGNPLITSQFYVAIPYSAFAFEGVAVLMPLREIVADQQNFMKLVGAVCMGIFTLYVVFAEWSILSWGNLEPYPMIVDALPETSIFTYSLKVLYTINLFFSYPMQMTPAIQLIEPCCFKPD